MHPIKSSHNAKIREVRALYRSKERRATGKLVLDGIRLIEDAVSAGVKLETILYSVEANERANRLLTTLAGLPVELAPVEEKLLQTISPTTTSQGVLAVAKQPANDLRQMLQGAAGYLVIVDNIRDPGNLGTIVRTSAAVGASGLILTKGTTDPFNPKVLRATMGAIFRLPLSWGHKPEEVLPEVKKSGYSVVVADTKGKIDYYDISYPPKSCLVVGNEADGPHSLFRQEADNVVKIPMPGGTESLNAAMACGIILFEALRQHRRESQPGPR